MGMPLLPQPIWWRRHNWECFGSKHSQSSLVAERAAYLEHLKQWHLNVELMLIWWWSSSRVLSFVRQPDLIHAGHLQGSPEFEHLSPSTLLLPGQGYIMILSLTLASAKVKAIDIMIWCWYDVALMWIIGVCHLSGSPEYDFIYKLSSAVPFIAN
jgi:hypothetical protein